MTVALLVGTLCVGVVRGGHVDYGCTVRTTAEVLVALLPQHRFSREIDATFGYRELVVRTAGARLRALPDETLAPIMTADKGVVLELIEARDAEHHNQQQEG